ncbi:hypothetical protein [Ornithinimicrobium cavernae]|uniref:hypothetical protein n=1 Tax=Ornithinimicrobium cavernae TaxID=2666047 RepID=UPI000D694568|nr:hypothetical protein [Ornithinimicrobium cavernae]
MTGRQPGTGGNGRDPVEEFFAAHRAQVREEPADEVAWRRIRDGRQGARSARRGAWTGALVAAAAALGLVFGPSLLPDTEEPNLAGPGPSATDPSGGSSTASEDPTGEDTQAPTDELIPDPVVVTTPVPEGGLPADGRFTDVTTADPEPATDSGQRYAIVMHPCSTRGWCSVLADSADGGTTWAPRADLAELGMVHRVLFADHGRGWVWGDKAPVWTTTDGGRTWSGIDTGAGSVTDLALQGDELIVATSTYDDCARTTCLLPSGSVLLTDPTGILWAQDVVRDLGPVESAEIIGAAGGRYVVALGEEGRVSEVLRLQEGRLESTAELGSCEDGPVAVTASVDSPDHLWALCEDQRGLALHETDNGGRTWTPANLTVPSFVLGEQPPLLASTGAGHLLLVGEGNYAVTTDGGQTWSAEAFLPGADARPEQLEATMFGELIAYPTQDQVSEELAYWSSVDGGLIWEVVRPGG